MKMVPSIVKFSTSASLAIGRYKGNLKVSACTDSGCKSHLKGSPFKVPYDIAVIPPQGSVDTYNLSELKPLPGAKDWGTFQGNAHHTGFVPATLDVSAFNLRWRWNAPAPVQGYQIIASDIATGNGRLFISSGGGKVLRGGAVWNIIGHGHGLMSYREFDGSKVWEHSFEDAQSTSYATSTNPPAYSDNKVFLVSSRQGGADAGSMMYAFDAATGAALFKSTVSEASSSLAPTIANGVAYTAAGSWGSSGLFAFDASNGQKKSLASLAPYDNWTPSVDSGTAYVYVAGQLQIINAQTGEMEGSIADPSYSWSGYSTDGAPVIGAAGSLLAGSLSLNPLGNALVNFDTSTKSVRWQTPSGRYVNQPAYAGGEFFIANSMPLVLESRRESDGKVLWSWQPPVGEYEFVSNVVATNNLVFVSTEVATYAIDRSTHQTRWRFSASGSLAISINGILYINQGRRIAAINLH
jgi:outer membrane protein assembly factor BamB